MNIKNNKNKALPGIEPGTLGSRPNVINHFHHRAFFIIINYNIRAYI